MSDILPRCMPAELIGRLRTLAERRRAHFHDLHESGRWKLYYSESEFAALESAAVQAADAVARVEASIAM